MENKTPPPNPVSESNISQTPPVFQSSQTPPAVKASKFSMKIIIGIIIFLLLAGGAAAGFVYREPLMKLVAKPAPTLTPTISITLNPTHKFSQVNDWNTYTSPQELGFQLNYPPNLVFIENNIVNDALVGLSILKLKGHLHEFGGEEEFRIFVYRSTENWEKFFQGQHEDIISFERKTVNGVEFFKITDKVERVPIYYLKFNNLFFMVSTLPNTEALPLQILSTIKSIDTHKNSSTSWISYKNNDYSFLYPPDWKLNTIGFTHIITPILNKSDTKNIIIKDFPEILYEPDPKAKKTYFALDGKEGIRNDDLINESQATTVIEIEKDGTYYHWELNYNPNDQNTKEVFDQILSTFKFTNSQTVDTSNWKTYTSKFGFELKYPPDWKVNDNSYGSGGGAPNRKVGLTSPLRYDLKGYETTGYQYLIQIDLNGDAPQVSFQNFIKGYENGDQATENVDVSKEYTTLSNEYEIAQEILRSAKLTN